MRERLKFSAINRRGKGGMGQARTKFCGGKASIEKAAKKGDEAI
jgi:hypothetical protein